MRTDGSSSSYGVKISSIELNGLARMLFTFATSGISRVPSSIMSRIACSILHMNQCGVPFPMMVIIVGIYVIPCTSFIFRCIGCEPQWAWGDPISQDLLGFFRIHPKWGKGLIIAVDFWSFHYINLIYHFSIDADQGSIQATQSEGEKSLFTYHLKDQLCEGEIMQL